MKILRLKNIDKPYFNLREFARVMNISLPSAKVAASRYAKSGLLIRLKRDLYVLADQWNHLSIETKFQFANLIQSPSYVSLLSALSYYQISTQIQQEFIESIAIKRTRRVTVENTVFNYSKIKKDLYFGFQRSGQFFIAEPEKALLDALYLMSLKRYTLDLDAIDFDRLNWNKVKDMLTKFPTSVEKMVLQYEPARTT
ncbi:MAG: hypothetical protein D6732_02970 [Methanobacteriota archaeon]|nr:MAG: hypothetical protein D6732_02970 [Euryarchaeota archaeon]